MELINPQGRKKIIVKKNECLHIKLENMEKKSCKFTLEVELIGENAYCEIQGRMQTSGKEQKIWNIKQKFLGKNQTGKIELHGTAEDESILQFNGTITLESKSKDANAEVKERILLFEKAKAFALPILTVKTNQVKNASHSASVEQINETQLLYLQTRGINKNQAKKLLKKGFLK